MLLNSIVFYRFNEEMIETLFGYPAVDKNKIERRKDSPSFEAGIQYIQLIDTKKAQNLSILLRALNVTTEEVRDALQEGLSPSSSTFFSSSLSSKIHPTNSKLDTFRQKFSVFRGYKVLQDE